MNMCLEKENSKNCFEMQIKNRKVHFLKLIIKVTHSLIYECFYSGYKRVERLIMHLKHRICLPTQHTKYLNIYLTLLPSCVMEMIYSETQFYNVIISIHIILSKYFFVKYVRCFLCPCI